MGGLVGLCFAPFWTFLVATVCAMGFCGNWQASVLYYTVLLEKCKLRRILPFTLDVETGKDLTKRVAALPKHGFFRPTPQDEAALVSLCTFLAATLAIGFLLEVLARSMQKKTSAQEEEKPPLKVD